ncbi:MAG: YgiQ family radical SAM protein [Lachnospiraceae bacterium]|jgi:uncharacterized radical SAM protein YgiQ|nr:YgiQ family radical SAM protein [Lachnospiraceae bacterium]
MMDFYTDPHDGFLPICKEDLIQRKIDQLDFVFVTGDAYVDHPSFGTALIARVLESHGYLVGILAQPDWKDEGSIRALGRPKLGFLVSAGNMDSQVNHYTVSKKRRKQDAYTPGGEIGKRPDHATAVYGNLIRRSYRDIPIILGGMEASLRRMAHYDYWTDQFKRSILLDSQADILAFGMGERAIVQIADALQSGLKVSDLNFIPGTVYKTKDPSVVYQGILLPSYDEIKEKKQRYAQSFAKQLANMDDITGKALMEPYPNGVYIVQNPPQPPLSMQEMDDVYALPYKREVHPSTLSQGGVPAIQEVKFSITSSRGCFGGCSFCSLSFHQGRKISARSHESILAEARLLTKDPAFKGYIHDVGGPTANFRAPACHKQGKEGVCTTRQCLFPKACPNLEVSHADYLSLLRKLRALPGVKKIFVRSGIRFDYLMADQDDVFFKELVEHHISGQLKVAPEHISDKVLTYMGKPQRAVYERFVRKYQKLNTQANKNQFLVPYFMSSHPGCGLEEAIELAEFLRDLGYSPEQVQDFYPTPSTLSTVMYATGINPGNGQPVYVCRNPHEKAMQRALIQYRNPKNYDLVLEALTLADRTDLIGFSPKCLIRPRDNDRRPQTTGTRKQNRPIEKARQHKITTNLKNKTRK